MNTTQQMILFRDFIIQPSLVGWEWVHQDFPRIPLEGYAATLFDCINDVAAWYSQHSHAASDLPYDLQQAISQSRKLHETLCCAKGARISGGDGTPIIADANARLIELANAMNHFADPIDDAARLVVEGARVVAA
ncbi:hypothetical protein [Devosia sp. 919]|uniref:hypothetical protein n=1 Tax=Devosia sp. 919 TaxID=2726065 RepID=UPI001556AFAE|nr:hypothetical protein [Devosia sp. 919]